MAFLIIINIVGLVVTSFMWTVIHFQKKNADESNARGRKTCDAAQLSASRRDHQ